MNNIKVTYFDVNGGRAEPIRIALFNAGIAFEDFRFSYAEFAEVRKSTPFGQVPVMDIDGVTITQSNALTRYAGKLAGLYPEDTFQALLCDEVMDTVEDITHAIVPTLGLTGDELVEARTSLTKNKLIPHLTWLENKLKERGDFFADNRLTIADLKVLAHLGWLSSGMLDHVPQDLIASTAPLLAEYQSKVMADPKVAGYYASIS
jgi:glutathione S-transferase